MAAGFSFIFHLASDQRAAMLLICSRSTRGTY